MVTHLQLSFSYYSKSFKQLLTCHKKVKIYQFLIYKMLK